MDELRDLLEREGGLDYDEARRMALLLEDNGYNNGEDAYQEGYDDGVRENEYLCEGEYDRGYDAGYEDGVNENESE